MNIHKNVSKIYASSGVNLDNSEKVKDGTLENELNESQQNITSVKDYPAGSFGSKDTDRVLLHIYDLNENYLGSTQPSKKFKQKPNKNNDVDVEAKEVSELKILSETQGYSVIGILVEDSKENGKEFIIKNEISYQNILDNTLAESILIQFIWSGIPTTLVLDDNFEIISTINGEITANEIFELTR